MYRVLNSISKNNIKSKISVGIVVFSAVLTVMLTGCSNSDKSVSENKRIEEDSNIVLSEDTDNGGDNKSLKDGEYDVFVSLSGGTGKVKLNNPTKAYIKNNKITLILEWSSPNYDYMIVNGTKIQPISNDGCSLFEVPIESLNGKIDVIADTVAMSKPHEIEYSISFSLDNNISMEEENDNPMSVSNSDEIDSGLMSEWIKNHSKTGELNIEYAEKFRVDKYDDKYYIIEINDRDYYCIVNEDNIDSTGDIPETVTVITYPLNNAYVVSTASFDFFNSLDALDAISFTSFKKNESSNERLKEKMEKKEIHYAGKYSAPDYELLLSRGCNLVVENTMISHSTDVLEQLHKLGIKTMIDYSSHESSPLGRMEWIKLYGVLLGKEDLAQKLFEEKEKALTENFFDTGKSVAYFYITNTGGVVVRKNQDYIAKLIQMAGGKYVFDGMEEYDGNGQMTIQKEAFFETVQNCDYLIYNSTISGKLDSADDLLAKCEVLKNTKAYKEGNVFCTNENIYLEVMELPEIAKEINNVLCNRETSDYIYRLK